MSEKEILDAVLDALRHVAPDVDVSSLKGAEDIRQQADLDSVDLVNLIVRLHERLGIDVPETDYGELTTLDGAVAYLSERLAGRPG